MGAATLFDVVRQEHFVFDGLKGLPAARRSVLALRREHRGNGEVN